MISGVFAILLGEALLAASLPVLCWFLLFVVANGVYVPLVEESGMAKRFGEEYEVYEQIVSRWFPRLTPWDGGEGSRQQNSKNQQDTAVEC